MPDLSRRQGIAGLLLGRMRAHPAMGWDRLVRLTVTYGAFMDPPVTVAEVHELRTMTVGELAAIASPAGDPDAQVETVLDVLAPKPDIPADQMTVLGLSPDVRVPVIRFDFEGRSLTPTDQQLRALAEQIVTRLRTTAAGPYTGPAGELHRFADQDIGGNAPALADELHDLADRIADDMRGGLVPGTGTKVHGLPRPAPSGPCICKGRGGHVDPACPWYGTDI